NAVQQPAATTRKESPVSSEGLGRCEVVRNVATCLNSSPEEPVSPTGVEPVTFGSGGRRPDSLRIQEHKELRQLPGDEVPIVVPSSSRGFSNVHLTPELAKIVNVWPRLQPAIKAVIVAMIDAAERAQENDLGRTKLSGMQSDAN